MTTRTGQHLVRITILLIGTAGYSCDWYVFNPSKWPSKYMENPPEVCRRVFNGEISVYSKEGEQMLAGLTIDDLLTLQRCGLAFHPQHQFQLDIANHDEYPVPALINRLQTDEDEYFQYYLILAFHALTTSKRHSVRFKSDKSLVISAIGDAISRMKDARIRELSETKFLSIKGFFDQSFPE